MSASARGATTALAWRVEGAAEGCELGSPVGCDVGLVGFDVGWEEGCLVGSPLG